MIQKRLFLVLLFILCFEDIRSQEVKPVYFSFGYSIIPLEIKRNHVVRFMIFPNFATGLKLNNELSFRLEYLSHDIRIKSYSKEKLSTFKEVPRLTSFSQAKNYLGEKFTLSLFSDYVFAGLQYNVKKGKFFWLQINGLLGFRFGETSVISYVTEQSYWPKGFEIHGKNLSSNSPGAQLSLNQTLIINNSFALEGCLGSYIFINWPVLQPFSCLRMKIYF